MVLIFEIHKDFVHERLCKFTPEIEANRNLSFLLYKFVGLDTSAAFRWDISTTGLGNTSNVVHLKINPTMRTSRAILDFLELSSASAVSGKLI